LVFVAASEGQSRLWLRPLGATSAQPLPGTEGASLPFWSPDSKSIAFFAESKLKRIDSSGGRPLPIADAAQGRGGTWNADGVILFAPTGRSPLFRVPASGGTPVAVTTLGDQVTHRFPFFLPDGRQFLFSAGGDTPGVYLGSMDSQGTHLLTQTDTAGTAYLPSGWLLWVRDGALVAQRLDVKGRALTGDGVTVSDSVTVDSTYGVFTASNRNGGGALSASASGLIAYRGGELTGQWQLKWFDRSGKMLGVLGASDEGSLSRPGLSPDGRRVAMHRTVQGNQDIWIFDGTRTSRFTFSKSNDEYALWSPDGTRIVFDSNRNGHRDLYVKEATGARPEELLLESPQDKTAHSWSADGRFLLYRAADPKTLADLWVLPLTGDRKPFVFLKTAFDEYNPQFSPDGRWVAYQSTESGQWEIYVRPFPGSGGQWQISTSGGSQVRWRPDGKELYYVAPDGTLMAAAVAVKGTTFEPHGPVKLFQPPIWGGGANTNNGQQYDVAPDGRFLINVAADERTASITLLTNWNPEAKK
jgi:Tol biopolymer transport system component